MLKFDFTQLIFVGYCSVSDARLLRGASADVLGDAEIGILIRLGMSWATSASPPQREFGIYQALLTAIKIYQRLRRIKRIGLGAY